MWAAALAVAGKFVKENAGTLIRIGAVVGVLVIVAAFGHHRGYKAGRDDGEESLSKLRAELAVVVKERDVAIAEATERNAAIERQNAAIDTWRKESAATGKRFDDALALMRPQLVRMETRYEEFQRRSAEQFATYEDLAREIQRLALEDEGLTP